ncbi:hypothetical protein EJB05_33646, partial [Eragrostis curvula]
MNDGWMWIYKALNAILPARLHRPPRKRVPLSCKYDSVIPSSALCVSNECQGCLLLIRLLWRHYFQNMQGIIFVVYSYDRDCVVDAMDEFHGTFNEDMFSQGGIDAGRDRQQYQRRE